jgi:hypothetical protein
MRFIGIDYLLFLYSSGLSACRATRLDGLLEPAASDISIPHFVELLSIDLLLPRGEQQIFARQSSEKL